jgi:hypothetical protein
LFEIVDSKSSESDSKINEYTENDSGSLIPLSHEEIRKLTTKRTAIFFISGLTHNTSNKRRPDKGVRWRP